MNTMWSALLLICAIDSEGQFKENLQCTATVSQQVWRGQNFVWMPLLWRLTLS